MHGLSLSQATVADLLIKGLDLGSNAVEFQGAVSVHGQHHRFVRCGPTAHEAPLHTADCRSDISQPFQFV